MEFLLTNKGRHALMACYPSPLPVGSGRGLLCGRHAVGRVKHFRVASSWCPNVCSEPGKGHSPFCPITSAPQSQIRRAAAALSVTSKVCPQMLPQLYAENWDGVGPLWRWREMERELHFWNQRERIYSGGSNRVICGIRAELSVLFVPTQEVYQLGSHYEAIKTNSSNSPPPDGHLMFMYWVDFFPKCFVCPSACSVIKLVVAYFNSSRVLWSRTSLGFPVRSSSCSLGGMFSGNVTSVSSLQLRSTHWRQEREKRWALRNKSGLYDVPKHIKHCEQRPCSQK